MSRNITLFLCLLTALSVCFGPSHAGSPALRDGTFQKETQSEREAIEGAENDLEVQNKATTKVRSARVHEEPSLEAAVEYGLKKGDVVSVIATKGAWYFIERGDGKKGWAHKSLFLEFNQDHGADPTDPNPKPTKNMPVESQKAIARPDKKKSKPEKIAIESDNDLMCLNFLDVDIREVLSALAMEREINISTAQDVSGKISIHLYHVSLNEALDAITLAGGFRYRKRGDMYYVYKPKEAVDPQDERLQMRIFKLKYADVDKVQEILEAIPGMRTIKTHEPSKTIIVEDTPENISKIRNVLAYWDKMPKQVMIEAKILEVELTDDMSLGVNWEKILGDVRIGTGGFGSATLPTTGTVSPVPATGTGIFGNIITGAGTRHQFTAALDALQTKTRINTLSTPKILAIHGKLARVQVGGQQGYPVTTISDGLSTESIEFIDTGTILEITPYIEDEGNILLNVHPSIDSARLEDNNIPVVKTTSASTWLVARDGETVFIGGLIQDTKTRTRNKVPILGSIPGLGMFFRRTTSGVGKSELVILITPNILDAEPRHAQQEAIEKTKKAEESFKNEPLPTRKRISEFLMPLK